jgi:signal transduction histidine kinase
MIADCLAFFRKLHRNDRLSEVEHQQINRIFLDTSPLALVLIVLFGVAGLVLWDHVPRVWLSLFIVGFITDVFIKLGIVENYKRQSPQQQQSGKWRRVIIFGVMYTSALWGASTLFLLVPMPVPNLVVGIGVFSTVLIIAMTLARSYLPVQAIGTCFSFLPMSIALLFSFVWQYQLLAVMLMWAQLVLLTLFRNSAEVAASRITERARREERNRMVRELHDGMGAHLMSAIALSEQQHKPLQVQSALRAALVEMRLLVGSVDGESRSLTQVLGGLREHLEPTIGNAGLKLIWDVALPPTTPLMAVPEQLHFTRVIQECVANVIKHAHATRITISSSVRDGYIDVHIADDGAAEWDVSNPQAGHGTKNIAWRMEQLGGEFRMVRSGGGTQASIAMPASR